MEFANKPREPQKPITVTLWAIFLNLNACDLENGMWVNFLRVHIISRVIIKLGIVRYIDKEIAVTAAAVAYFVFPPWGEIWV